MTEVGFVEVEAVGFSNGYMFCNTDRGDFALASSEERLYFDEGQPN